MMASTQMELQELVNSVGRIAGEYGTEINRNNNCDDQRGICY